ncbi:hypothetical protein [Sandaracinus amylolyticus]|uniref:hypothetical protein n=1 Tax=Sandaracinus amylolyticus TaxID=927083 RepID=UPI001F427ED5|nr:hypothetical protein [Sandaracinus amylolyticus]UJR82366.1 Hypothetical protein I5071_44310 [Sandaracinus amylolyticus]
MPAVNFALALGGAPVRIDTGGAGTQQAVLFDMTAGAERALQQAVLHLAALRAHGFVVDPHLAAISGCDVDAACDPSVAEGMLGVIEERIRLAGRWLSSQGGRPVR